MQSMASCACAGRAEAYSDISVMEGPTKAEESTGLEVRRADSVLSTHSLAHQGLGQGMCSE